MTIEDNSNNDERFDIAKVVILSGWSLSLLVCIVVIGAAVYTDLKGQPSGSAKEWAGVCLGFLLGKFMDVVKEFLSK